MKKILSFNPIGHDTSAALMISNEIVSACEQERYTFDKHSRLFPIDAINDCLRLGGINISQIDLICIPWNPKLMIREFYLKTAINNDLRLNYLMNDFERVKELFDMEKNIRKKLQFHGEIRFFNHHECHMASTYFSSGFKDPLIVSYDGCGEIDTMGIGIIENNKINIKINNKYPNSLGLLYSAVTNFLGWKYACDEGIVMGLASTGNANEIIPKQKFTYIDFFRKALVEKSCFDYKLIMPKYFNFFEKRDVWVGNYFFEIMGPKRMPNSKITRHHANIAAALQLRIEEVIINQIRKANMKYNKKKLCISGGVGLNCTLNGKLVDERLFEEIFIVPPSGDPGTTIGACYLGNDKNKIKKRHNFYLGSKSTKDEILKILKENNLSYHQPKNIFKTTSNYLKEGKIIGWYQGGTEFGPRALGNRSILTKPFPKSMKDYVNKQVKFRENFRPFAPAVIDSFKKDYFHMSQESPHMLMAVKVKKNKIKEISATVHDDFSSRVQTVTKENNLKFYNLLQSFFELTGIPVLLNTSFNIKGQPIVNTPQEAIKTFLTTKIDILVIDDFILTK